MSRLFSLSLLLVLAWGALAFGAEYPWAYAPLLVLAAVTGVLGFRASAATAFPSRPLVLALVTLGVAAATQLLPLSPAALAVVRGQAPDVNYAQLVADTTQHPVPKGQPGSTTSIAPERTWLGLAFLVSLALLFIGATRAVSRRGMPVIVRGVVAISVVVAFAGIIQAAVRSVGVYGFWLPPKPDIPFAPFVNENHFTGWMVMAMSLSAGRLAGGMSSAMGTARGGWRNRVFWLSSPQASETALCAVGVGIAALSIVLAGSRGGLVGLSVALLASSWWALRRQSSWARRIAGAGSLATILIAALAWGDAWRIVDQFDGAEVSWGGRRSIWQAAWRIGRDYPLTGTGLNTFGIAMLHYQPDPLTELVVEAHNDYLQLAAEGGLLLGIPILITIALFIREVRKRFKEGADDERTYWLRAGAVTGLISIAVMEIFDFTLQMPGAAVLFVVLCAIAIHKPDYLARRREARPTRK